MHQRRVRKTDREENFKLFTTDPLVCQLFFVSVGHGRSLRGDGGRSTSTKKTVTMGPSALRSVNPPPQPAQFLYEPPLW